MTAFEMPHGGSSIRLELPPARREPLDLARQVWPVMGYRGRFLAQQLIGTDDVFAAVRTGTRIDVGTWLLRGRVWVFALRDSLAVVACGPCGLKVRAERVPYESLRESQYNHVTGELALAPAKGLPLRGLALDPLDAYQLLAQIYRED
ncbi:MAG TPA: hypothetical protein VM031_05010 [Phycisphaerae bacterium]|nr:hypothetical protein [Phycisphaerae bacterium]